MNSLDKAAYVALKICMGLKKNESLLVVYDQKEQDIAKALFESGRKISNNVKLLKIKKPKVNGEEPSLLVANDMLKYDVIMLVTSKSLSHTSARRNASFKGARIASMPGITQDMFVRGMGADYKKIEKRTKLIADILNKGKIVRILTDKGTDLIMDIAGRFSDGGVLPNRKGSFHNLPSGEACLAPIEGTTNGTLIVDASFLEKVDKPINIKIVDGYAVSIEGGKTALKLKKALDSVKDKNAYAVAELGIGTNDKAKIIGKILEDEKVLGTAHIAFGNNKSYGGKIDVPIHLDGVFLKPTIFVDDIKIMQNGKLLI
jgi:leucyl aminopeptidase (aminopeptidase T)